MDVTKENSQAIKNELLFPTSGNPIDLSNDVCDFLSFCRYKMPILFNVVRARLSNRCNYNNIKWYILWSTLKYDLFVRPGIGFVYHPIHSTKHFDQNILHDFDFLTSERMVYLVVWLTLYIFSSYPHVFDIILRYCSHPKCYSVHGYKIKIICNYIEMIRKC